ncbi:MAG: hypothetical protein KF678_02405 [Phycisphaeraceae bacterium]|nr:hypothetical protein [Phycisphaeraceae bacterium]
MYHPKVDGTRDEERFAKPGETLFQHLFRTHEYWRQRPDTLVFVTIPAELKQEYPDVYGRIDDERLGTMVALVWAYLGGKGSVNDRVIRKWFRDAVLPEHHQSGGSEHQ